MRSVIGEILPLALVVTVSPINIIPSILLLFTKRPKRTATAFLVGFMVGVGAVLALFVAVAGAISFGSGSGHSAWALAVKGGLGAYLIVAGVRKFRGRPRGDAHRDLPAWMDSLSSSSPSRALGVGVVLGAGNPKNLVVALATGVVVSTGGLSTTQQLIACGLYVLVAAAGVAAPIVTVFLLGDRSAHVLDDWRTWLEKNNATVMAVLFFVFGVVLLGRAIAG